jgi:hypothetical protein
MYVTLPHILKTKCPRKFPEQRYHFRDFRGLLKNTRRTPIFAPIWGSWAKIPVAWRALDECASTAEEDDVEGAPLWRVV